VAHKRRHAEEGEGVNLSLVITPMLDMSFQLLAFFIMTYHPSDLEAHIDGKLLPPAKVAAPSSGGAPVPKKDGKKEPPPVDVDPDAIKTTVRVIVKKVADKRVYNPREKVDEPAQDIQVQIKPPEATEPRLVVDHTMDLDKVGLPLLHRELEKIRNAPGGEAVNVVIDADPALMYDYFIRVQDTCKAAKFASVGFAAPLPAGP
jgi:biopolymer transport protein ExbD